jgi:hypothetical protein
MEAMLARRLGRRAALSNPAFPEGALSRKLRASV